MGRARAPPFSTPLPPPGEALINDRSRARDNKSREGLSAKSLTVLLESFQLTKDSFSVSLFEKFRKIARLIIDRKEWIFGIGKLTED